MKKFIPFESGALETVETVMVRDPLILSPLMRAREALARLRQVGVPRDFMANCYVADEGGRLLGSFTLRELVMVPDHRRLDQVMSPPPALLRPEDDRERAAALMDWTGCVELPVVDGEGRLVGTVTAGGVLEVLREEATEDMERMAAIRP